jgi:uncharacterized Zn-finger protein
MRGKKAYLAAVDLACGMGIIAAHQGQSARPISVIFQRSHPAMATQPVETVEVTTARVACDGGPGALGHPKVYLNLAKGGAIDCPYCGKRFILKEGAKAGADAH